MRLRRVAVFDWTTNRNGIQHGSVSGPPACAIISIDIRWAGMTSVADVCDSTNHYKGRFIQDIATFQFKVTQPGFSFTSDPAITSVTEFSQIGRERNGSFFVSCP